MVWMPALAVWCWMAVGALHAWLTVRLVARAAPPEATAEDWLFASVLGAIGGLAAALHAVAVTVGLSFASGVCGLALWHVALYVWVERPMAERARAVWPRLSWSETAAVIATLGILLSWIQSTAQSAAVTGADAANYHIPHAINFARGVRLFDLPATQHLYPVAGSLIAGWFIVPVDSVLLADAAMCLPFLLLGASMHLIFRMCTGVSGIAWSSWLLLLLFATPLFRQSSHTSADLWFAAAFVAFTASIVALWTRRASGRLFLALSALACGLLVGVKATGVVAACLLAGLWLTAEAGRRIRRSVDTPREARPLVTAAGLVALFLVGGGIWLVRGWVLFGSPLAPSGLTLFGLPVFAGEPLQPSTHFSVLGDLTSLPDYDLTARATRYVRLWLGPWFLPFAAVTLLIPIDALAARHRRRADRSMSGRMMLLVLTAGAGGTLVALLVGAPWTSLEWTRGFALRYALPVAALVPLVSLVALFPSTWRWYGHPATHAVTLALSATWVARQFVESTTATSTRSSPLPPVTFGWLVAAASLVVVASLARHVNRARRVGTMVAAASAFALAASWIAARNTAERLAADQLEVHQLEELAQGRLPLSPAREVYLTVRRAELGDARVCSERRFLVLTRFDDWYSLQSGTARNTTFYAGRDSEPRLAAQLTSCDYVVTTRPHLETARGAALLSRLAAGAALREIATTDAFIVLALP
jgi:hypothetical protein